MTYVQILLNGILIGALWGVLGLGKQLILGILRFVNFAHANFALIGMYVMYFLWSWTKVDPYVLVPLVVIAVGLLGLAIEAPLIRPLVRRGERAQMIATLALLILIQNVLNLLFGPSSRSIQTTLDTSGYHLTKGLFVTKTAVDTFAVGVVAFVAIWLIMSRTTFGLKVRATAQRRESAIYSGIDVQRVYGRAFALSIALAGLVGALYAIDSPANPTAAAPLLVLMFVVPILGGLGSLPGALLGGFVVGILQGLTTQIFPPQLENAIIYAVFVAFLLVRPRGILGSSASLYGRTT
jgi:branched-chain amino acid transport system permease protein